MQKLRLLLLMLAVLASPALAADRDAPDFPPGAFTDGGSYRLADFKGKVLVLFFYEQDCPTCRGSIPKRNEMVEKYKDKPVKFIAVAAGDNLVEAKAYKAETKLVMPAFADNLSLMENAYGFTISLRNIYQMRAITTDGQVQMIGMMGEGLDKLLDQAKWKYKSDDYDPKLNGVIDLLEWNQYEAGMKQLAPFRKNKDKDVAASAEKLYGVVKAEADEWQKEADAAVESDPGRALELYLRIVACFPSEPTTKQATDAFKKLQASKPMKDEFAARKLYGSMATGFTNAKPENKKECAAFAQSIAKKYPDTVTGKRCAEIAEQLAK